MYLLCAPKYEPINSRETTTFRIFGSRSTTNEEPRTLRVAESLSKRRCGLTGAGATTAAGHASRVILLEEAVELPEEEPVAG